MKHNFLKIFFTTLLLMCCTVMSAQSYTYDYDFKVDGINYNILSEEDKTVEVASKFISSEMWNNYTGTVIIPENVTYNGTTYTVTEIGASAFYYAKYLDNVIIPKTVTKISGEAFGECGIQDIEIPNSVTIIEGAAFSRCSAVSITMSNSVTTIENGLFYGCNNLEYVKLPENLTYIGNNAFYECKKLKAVSATPKLTYIGDYAFKECREVEGITISDSVTYIGEEAFMDCNGLKNITIPGKIKYLGSYAFASCKGLESVTLKSGFRGAGEFAFSGCTNLKNLTIESGVTGLGSMMFCGCSGIKSVVIPASLNSSYGGGAFWNCYGLETLIFEEGITAIGSDFQYCTGLKSFVIPNSATSIGPNAFCGCTGLENIIIPNSVTSIGNYTFQECTGLTEVTIGSGVTDIGSSAFYNCKSLTSITSLIPAEKLSAIWLYDDSFYGVNKSVCTLYVPYGAKETYAATEGWNEFKHIKEIRNNYKVTFIVENEVVATESVTEGDTIVYPAVLEKEGYTFRWIDAPQIMPSEDIVITGKYTVNKYLLTYKVDGDIYASDSVAYGSVITPLAEPSKEGHTFGGWSEIPATMPAKDVVIEGKYSVNKYLLTYMVDGSVYASDSVAYGSVITPLAEPSKEGCTFSGWSEIPATMPAKDVVIEGKYSVNKYLLTYMVDGSVYASDSVAYGSVITPLAEPSKEGYTFSGWSEIPATMPAKDVVIEGKCSVNKYLLTYMVDGSVYASDSVAYGSVITPLAEPSKEGCTFSGWSEIPATMPARDVIIQGTFSVNNYVVIFMIDGEIYKTATVKYGAEIELPAVPEKEGYIFSGWTNVPATMPANDIVINGSYIVETAIGAVNVDLDNNEVYNLKGQRIIDKNNLTRGVYILNGRKVLLK